MFRNRTTFERNVLTRRYGYNNTGDNPQTGQNGGFNSTATASSSYVAGVAWVPDPPFRFRPPAPAPAPAPKKRTFTIFGRKYTI